MAASAEAVTDTTQVRPRIVVASTTGGRKLPLGRQLFLQAICLFITFTVLFPILWIVGMSVNPRDVSHPKDIIPPGATLAAYSKVIAKPTLNPVSFPELAFN